MILGLIVLSIVALFALVLLLLNIGWYSFLLLLLHWIVVLVPVLVGVLYLILAERKMMAYAQGRLGPNRVGPWGLLQTIADGAKFLSKEIIVPVQADRGLFFLAPILSLMPAFAIWALIPIDIGWVMADVDAGVLAVLALSSIGAYGVILAGWSSKSTYAFFGAIRAMAQVISYEIAMGFALVAVLLLAGSMNITTIVIKQSGGVMSWYIWPLLPIAVVYGLSGLAEVNRAPFDVVEGESEIVAGYQVEYSGFAFAMFFVAEYTNMIVVSALFSLFFLGGWDSPFGSYAIELNQYIPGAFWLLAKTVLMLYLMIWIRVSVPRYRMDQLMSLGWKVFIPIALVDIVLIASMVWGGWL